MDQGLQPMLQKGARFTLVLLILLGLGVLFRPLKHRLGAR